MLLILVSFYRGVNVLSKSELEKALDRQRRLQVSKEAFWLAEILCEYQFRQIIKPDYKALLNLIERKACHEETVNFDNGYQSRLFLMKESVYQNVVHFHPAQIEK